MNKKKYGQMSLMDTSLDTRHMESIHRGGWNASEVQGCYTESAENINVSGGSLNLIGLYKPGVTCNKGKNKDFTSGFVETKDKKAWTYGYFEARIKMPNNKSTWPAFWMSPNEKRYGGWPMNGEIDIVETKGSDLDYAAADAHWGKSTTNKTNNEPSQKTDLQPGFKNTTHWHTYGVKWTEGKLEYYIDGERDTIQSKDLDNQTQQTTP
ncbi:glycoside hydrolase family 16 protein [Candidatus Minimicrobia naudis]|uniref:Glycoside hydrolase family 16 protein n=1 Tax=Candidatus Minimicrobia naudis TaxID=2841263 RepID=A0A8F1MCA0_9BACT|nr:glycoside hydrolase family 16 protein [Candidatus Minimicrobia naudis]